MAFGEILALFQIICVSLNFSAHAITLIFVFHQLYEEKKVFNSLILGN